MSAYPRPASPVRCIQVNDTLIACEMVQQPQQQIIVAPQPQPQPQQLAIMSSQDCVTTGPYNIDNSPVQTYTPQGGAFGSTSFFTGGPRSLISSDPIIDTLPMITKPMSNVGMPGQPPIQTALVTPGSFGGSFTNPGFGFQPPAPPKTGKQIDSRYPRKPVNMNRAIGFAVVMSCLCPPLGLFGLGTALKGRNNRYTNEKKARKYRRASYSFSLMAVILIVMGVVIIVLLSQRYNKF